MKKILTLVVVVIALAVKMEVSGYAQQPPSAAPGPGPDMKVVVAGENPEVSKFDKEGGTAVSNVNFFRVTWSPAGAGSVCVVTVQNQPNAADNFRIAIYDDQAVYDYMIKEIRSDYASATPLKGTITQTNSVTPAEGFTRTETCKSDKYTVEAVWKNLGPATWSDMMMFGGKVHMTFVMVRAGSGDIIVNGKPAPGTFFQKAPRGSGAYLTLDETWRR